MALLFALVSALPFARSVRAELDPSAREAARLLGNEGVQLFESGDFAQVLDRFERRMR